LTTSVVTTNGNPRNRSIVNESARTMTVLSHRELCRIVAPAPVIAARYG